MSQHDNIRLCGVYVIRNLQNGKVYIGSTAINFRKRWREHRTTLLRGTHDSGHLQRAWNKYGESAFEFNILRVTKPEEAVLVEQSFIDFYQACDPKRGYNILPLAGRSAGFKHSEEFKASVSERSKKMHADPVLKARYSALMKARQADPEFKAANSARAKAMNSDPVLKAAKSAKMKVIHSDPVFKAALSARMKKMYADPEFKAKNSAMLKAVANDPVTKAAASKRMTAWNAAMSPEDRDHWRAKISLSKRLKSGGKKLMALILDNSLATVLY